MVNSVSIILPTYNEAGHIRDLIEQIYRNLEDKVPEIEIVVVDDDSPDGTARIIKEAFKDVGWLKVLVRTEERGLASAILLGLKESTKSNLVFMDTDFNHEPRVITLLLKQLGDFDIAIGSRFVAGGGMKGPQFRYWGSYLFNVFVKLVLRIKTNDNLCGFFAVSRETLNQLDLENIFTGYGDYFIRLLQVASRKKLSLIEVPVVYQERPSGQSKTNFVKHFFRYLKTVLLIRAGRY